MGHWISANSTVIQQIAMGSQFIVGALTLNPLMMASAGTSLYESISGRMIGDGTLSRILGTTNILAGGFLGGAGIAGTSNSLVNTASNLSRIGLTGVASYETMSGDRLLGGTLSSVLYGTQLATGTLPIAMNSGYTLGSRAIAGLQVGLGVTSLAAGDSALGRSVNIAGSLWATGQNLQTAYDVVSNTLVRAQSPDNNPRRTTSGVVPVSYEEEARAGILNGMRQRTHRPVFGVRRGNQLRRLALALVRDLHTLRIWIGFKVPWMQVVW